MNQYAFTTDEELLEIVADLIARNRRGAAIKMAVARLLDIIEEITDRYNDARTLNDMRWQADRRAIDRWQRETGQKLTLPDHADLVVWLMFERLKMQEKRDGKR